MQQLIGVYITRGHPDHLAAVAEALEKANIETYCVNSARDKIIAIQEADIRKAAPIVEKALKACL